jgi:hypothetical protein
LEFEMAENPFNWQGLPLQKHKCGGAEKSLLNDTIILFAAGEMELA